MSESNRLQSLVRLLAIVVVAVIAAAIGFGLFLEVPTTLQDLLGVLLTIVLVLLAIRIVGGLVGQKFPTYNVAEVAVRGPITRSGGSRNPLAVVGHPADEIVDQIERADDDPGVRALLLRLNTPGGEVVPSDDIKRAAEEFDGPTIAYATDTCASGGYWIASGCDELWARDASLVGSIGVIGSRPNVHELADRLGITYERFAAGEYKDAGIPLKELSEDERAYLQGIIDDFYDHFVERVAAGRDMDPEQIRDTEARLYLGREAERIGLVDELGTREDVEDHVEDLLEEPITVQQFEPQRGLRARIGAGAAGVAYAFGAGIASAITTGTDVDGFEFRM